MPLPKFYKVVQDQNGNIVPQVLGSVFNHGTAVLASLYQDDAGTLPLSNPMTSDAQYGSFKFYVNPGHYDLTFTKPGYTFEPIMDFQVPEDTVTLGTMATQNANAVAITGGGADFLSYLGVTGNGFVQGTLQVMGSVGLGTAPGGSRVTLRYLRGTQNGLHFQPDSDSGAAACYFTNAASTAVGTITTTATATAYNTSSDRRLKEAIGALPDALATLLHLRPVQFRWRADGSPGVGFLADEVAAVVPAAVTGAANAVTADGQIVAQGMDASKLVPWLVGAIQDLTQQVQALSSRLAALEGP